MKASTKSVLFAFAATSLSVVMIAPTSAQVFKPRDQTCDNASTARDKTLRPDTRCLRRPKEGSAFEKWWAKNAAEGYKKAQEPLVPGGPLRRDYVPANSGGGGGGGGSSKGKKPK